MLYRVELDNYKTVIEEMKSVGKFYFYGIFEFLYPFQIGHTETLIMQRPFGGQV